MDDLIGFQGLKCSLVLESIYNNPMLGIVISSPQKKVIRANNTFCKFLGYQVEELIGKDFADLTLKADFERESELFEKLINKELEYFNFQKRFIRKDGTVVWGEISVSCHQNEDTETFYCIGVVRDINAEKEQESLFADSELMFREIYNNTSDAIFIIDVIDGRFFVRSVNPAEAELTGLTKEILGDGKFPEEFLPPEIAEAITNNYRICYESGKPYQYEETLTLPGGTRTWSTTLVPVRNPQGEIIKIIGFSRDQTELKNAYAELEKFRLTIQNANDAFYWIDKDGRIIFVNDSASYMLGYSAEEFSQLEIFDIDANLDEMDWVYFWNDLRTNVYANFETIHKKKDGTTLPVELTISFLKFEDTEFLSVFVKDISERKAIERKLKASEAKLSRIFNTEWEAIVILDFETRKVVDMNLGAELNFGFTKEDIIGKTIDEVGVWVDKADQEIVEKEALETGAVRSREVLLRDKEGKIRSTLLSAQKITLAEGDYLAVFVKDISDLKAKEQLLLEAQERYRIINDNSYAGIVLYKSDGSILSANPFFCKLLGYSLDELRGMNFSTITYPDDLPAEVEFIYKLVENKIDNYTLEKRYITKQKDTVCTETYVSAYRNSRNEIEYFISVVVDITERKRLERELRKALAEAQKSDRLKTLFLNNISHEIRTPLSSIINYSNLFLYDIGDEAKKNYVNRIQESCFNLLDVVEMTLDLSRIELQDIALDYSHSSLNVLLDTLKDKLEKSKIRYKKADVELIIENNIEDKSFVFYVDSKALLKILYQIADNGIKFTEKGLVKVECELTKDESLLFTISDTGTGIPLSKQPLIFDKFTQLDEAITRKYGGMGIGLAIAKGYVEVLEGKLWLESVPNEGSKFFVKIPLSSNKLNKDVKEEKIAQPLTPPDKSLTLFEIVDDLNNTDIKGLLELEENLLSHLCDVFCGTLFAEWENLMQSSTESEIRSFAEQIRLISEQHNIVLMAKYSKHLIEAIDTRNYEVFPQLFRLYSDYAIKLKEFVKGTLGDKSLH